MTIAIGLLATDGVILAADSQETLGSFKSDESKFLIANQGLKTEKAGAIAITGAGDSGYLDSINQELCTAFLSKKKWTPLALLGKTRTIVKTFHHDHVVPYGKFPEHDRPEMRLIIGSHINGRGILWSTEKSTVSGGKRYFAVGIGYPYARVMLRRFWTPMDTVKAASLAAYILFQVKNTADGCGKETQIVIIKDGHAAYLSQDNINLLEYAFEERARTENLFLHFSLGLDLPEDDIKTTLARFSFLLDKSRKDVIDCQRFKMSSYHAGKRPLDEPEMMR